MKALLLAVLLLLVQVRAATALERAMLGKSQVVDETQAQIESARVGGVQERTRPVGIGENEWNGKVAARQPH